VNPPGPSTSVAVLFREVVVCVEEWVDPASPEGSAASATAKPQKAVRSEPESPPLPAFVQDIVDTLGVLRFSSNEFLSYVQSVDLKESFSEGAKYTALIPFDKGFRQWYPIDWGFNPFDVSSFVQETVLDHFLEGEVLLENVGGREDSQRFRTLGGKEVTFIKNHDGKAKEASL